MHKVTCHRLCLFCIKSYLQFNYSNIPINADAGSTCNVSPLLRFHFWQPIYFNSDYSRFPSDSTEETGRFAGISENAFHDVTFSILNAITNKVINRSNARQTCEPTSPNLRISPITAPEVVSSRHFPSDYVKDNEEAPAVIKD